MSQKLSASFQTKLLDDAFAFFTLLFRFFTTLSFDIKVAFTYTEASSKHSSIVMSFC